jgi:hypothetical protein
MFVVLAFAAFFLGIAGFDSLNKDDLEVGYAYLGLCAVCVLGTAIASLGDE